MESKMNENNDEDSFFGKRYDNESADEEDVDEENCRLSQESDFKASNLERKKTRLNQRSTMDIFTNEHEALVGTNASGNIFVVNVYIAQDRIKVNF
jgi:hypothetical protein